MYDQPYVHAAIWPLSHMSAGAMSADHLFPKDI